MKLPSASPARGLTIIEVLVVIGLLAVVFGFSYVIGLDAIGRSVATGERDLAVTFLETARTEALANIDESPHGLHIDESSFVLFSGDAYDPDDANNRPYDRSPAVTTSPAEVDIIFEQLSGAVLSGEGTITFSDGAQSATVEINEEGRINW